MLQFYEPTKCLYRESTSCSCFCQSLRFVKWSATPGGWCTPSSLLCPCCIVQLLTFTGLLSYVRPWVLQLVMLCWHALNTVWSLAKPSLKIPGWWRHKHSGPTVWSSSSLHIFTGLSFPLFAKRDEDLSVHFLDHKAFVIWCQGLVPACLLAARLKPPGLITHESKLRLK